MIRQTCLTVAAIVVVSMTARLAWADDAKPVKPVELPKVTPNRADEPLAKEFSLKKSAVFLDGVAGAWVRRTECGSCHTSYPYLMGRPALLDKNTPAPIHDEIRKFFENQVANWDASNEVEKKKQRYGGENKSPITGPLLEQLFSAEVVSTAVCLAINDSQTTGKLHPLTRQALDRMWTVQLKNGGWDWTVGPWPPMAHDRYYAATFAAIGVACAPDHYAQSAQSKAGLEKLRVYFKNTPPPFLHHKAMLLWAAQTLDGLMTQAEKDAAIKELFAVQNEDGGWSLPGLGYHKSPSNGSANDAKDSDGYGTGYVIYILRQANIPASDERLQRGVVWLKTHQRESGRWFTRSLYNSGSHYITNAGTCYAVLALKACGVEEK